MSKTLSDAQIASLQQMGIPVWIDQDEFWAEHKSDTSSSEIAASQAQTNQTQINQAGRVSTASTAKPVSTITKAEGIASLRQALGGQTETQSQTQKVSGTAPAEPISPKDVALAQYLTSNTSKLATDIGLACDLLAITDKVRVLEGTRFAIQHNRVTLPEDLTRLTQIEKKQLWAGLCQLALN